MNSSTTPLTPNLENSELRNLKAETDRLETELIRAQVEADVYRDVNTSLRKHIAELERRLDQIEKRNSELENPKSGPRYSSLNWRGKIIFCIRKWKRPLRAQEIIAELEIMEAENDGLRYQGDNVISVVLAKAVKAKALHIEKIPGTRGAFYALPEWLEEDGKLSAKMKRSLW